MLEKGLRPQVLAINVSKFLPASRCSKRQLGIRSQIHDICDHEDWRLCDFNHGQQSNVFDFASEVAVVFNDKRLGVLIDIMGRVFIILVPLLVSLSIIMD